MVARSGIDPEKKVNEVTAKERERLVEAAKSFHVTLTGLRGYNEAIITPGRRGRKGDQSRHHGV